MKFKLKTLTGQIILVDLPDYNPSSTTVDELKLGVERFNGVPPPFQRLIFGGKELQSG